MAKVRLLKDYGDHSKGEVVDLPAVEARSLIQKGEGLGGRAVLGSWKPGKYDYVFADKPTFPESDRPKEETIEPKTSTDYKVKELRDMDLADKPDAFFEGDDRKTVARLRG